MCKLFNVCIYRILRGESISYPPSHCTNCSNKIIWYDLIPVLSYILFKGKCKNCGEKISLRYPVIEIITSVLFAVLYKIWLKFLACKICCFNMFFNSNWYDRFRYN